MTRPWKVLAKARTPEGELELRQRGDTDFLIVIDGRVLMNSYSRSSEEELARLACSPLARGRGSGSQSGRGSGGGGARASAPLRAPTSAPRVLIAGLGMGFTLRAALDVLPPAARVTVCEINDVVVDWCRGPDGPLAAAIRNALSDTRVDLQVRDVADVIARAPAGHFDAIVLDLYEGPNAASQRRDDPFYGSRALADQRRALAATGTLAVWSEDADVPYAKRLAAAGFDVKTHSIGSGGRRHIVYLAQPAPMARPAERPAGRRPR